MNYAAAAPLEADFFNESGTQKQYRPPVQQQQMGNMFILKKVHNPDPSNATYISEDGVEIQYNTTTSTSSSVPVAVPAPDFPFTEFPYTEVVTRSQIDFPSISDTLGPRENSNSSSKATRGTDLALKSMQNCSSYEEMRENRDLNVSAKSTQSTRDSYTISDNSTPRKSTPGTKADSPTALPVETSVSFVTDAEISESRSIMPSDVQTLTAL